jgi:hypothetical protein
MMYRRDVVEAEDTSDEDGGNPEHDRRTRERLEQVRANSIVIASATMSIPLAS